MAGRVAFRVAPAFGEFKPGGLAQKELLPEVVLQSGDMAADGALRDAQFLRGHGEGQMFGRGVERIQLWKWWGKVVSWRGMSTAHGCLRF